jgi:hypothetical protein
MRKYRIKETEVRELSYSDIEFFTRFGILVEEIKPEVKKLYAYCLGEHVSFYTQELIGTMQKRTPSLDIAFEEK